MDANKLVSTYIKIRDARAEIKAEYADKDAELKSKLDKIEAALLALYKEKGIESLKTEAGTASRLVRTRYWAPDWEAFSIFVKKHDAIDLLEHRIHQGNFKTFVEENPDLVVPVSVNSEYSIRVTRGRK